MARTQPQCNVVMRRWKVVTGLFLVWFLILMYMSNSLIQVDVAPSEHQLKLMKAEDEIVRLNRKNVELKRHLDKRKLKEFEVNFEKSSADNSNNDANLKVVSSDDRGPSLQYEEHRRKLSNDVREWWLYMRAQLTKSVGSDGELNDKVNDVLKAGAGYYKTIANDLNNVAGADAQWRRSESAELGRLVQNQIHKLQVRTRHPRATDHRLTAAPPKPPPPVYPHPATPDPPTQSIPTQTSYLTTHIHATGSNPSSQTIELPIIDSLAPRPSHLPQSIPTQLADRLRRLHGDPITWWVGQIIRYLCRPTAELQSFIDAKTKELDFGHPIVGVQVRRTDKVGTEAAYHHINEYMKHVQEYYDILEMNQTVTKKRVYLATDDVTVIQDAKKNYPDYTFLTDTSISQSAGLGTRYTDASLRGVILDIHFLSISDYIVCTFSSQVCRVAYEIMQTFHPDASKLYYSLDDIYYFGGQNGHNVRAIEPHTANDPSQIDLQIGDEIGIAGNHWDGFSKGFNHRTRKSGLFPSYKVTNVIQTANFPAYSKQVKR